MNPQSLTYPLFDVSVCGEMNEPGLGHGTWLVDFSDMPVTPDQLRLMEVLDTADLRGRAILHVGIGSSALASRLAERGAVIDGITISEREHALALELNLPGYRVALANKYRPDLMKHVNGPYDVIVDNNLASFVCCGFHLMTMLSSYYLLLKPGGIILTDQQGMDWVASGARWRLTENDLMAIAMRFSMTLSRIGDQVYALTKL